MSTTPIAPTTGDAGTGKALEKGADAEVGPKSHRV